MSFVCFERKIPIKCFYSLTANFERCFQLQQDGLAEEDFSRFQTQTTDFVLCQLHVLSRPGSTD